MHEAQSRSGVDVDVAVIGAGAAGVGMAWVLSEMAGVETVVLESGRVGESFRCWPDGMRFLTPSFTSNAFGMVDLNAITPTTSPAFTLGTEHPTGPDYADYLQTVVNFYELPVETGVHVQAIEPTDSGFRIKTNSGETMARFVVWAGGEYGQPESPGVQGADLGLHVGRVERWDRLTGGHHVVIGGYESGINAALELVELGHTVTVLDRGQPWAGRQSDPSEVLSPNTHDRLWDEHDKIELIGGVEVSAIDTSDVGFVVRSSDGREWPCDGRPILATGFRPLPDVAQGHFEADEDGFPIVTEEADESTRTPGLFLAGPALRHSGVVFCFIYKYRQRFAVVAAEIATRLGLDAEPLEELRLDGFYLDDLSCCDVECAC